ncbi:SWIM zinc finger family protein [Carbonactinospora thermoautotrophica]|uniref:SWIM zinc finger family protein n=1 Tax=Carbonactinospora thermoautotrophica TaxID=1469144 RepID=UPI000A81D42E|nr:hypothetical protein [Carbonactinospora thermoautotrophica]
MKDQKFGTTWWGRRWIRLLESLSATYPNPRLIRGRSLARKGAVRDLVVRAGEVTAQVTQGKRRHTVTLTLPVFTEAEWNAATCALSQQVRHAAALLEGRMPEDIDQTLGTAGVLLFPRQGELSSTCTCTDETQPCAHAAAVHYVLASRFDADPFLLPALRGRDRAAFLAGLRAARSGRAGTPAGEGRPDGIPLAQLSADRLFSAGGDLTAITLHPHQPDDPTATLRRLGPPPHPAADAYESLADAVRSAAAHAWHLAGNGIDEDRAPGKRWVDQTEAESSSSRVATTCAADGCASVSSRNRSAAWR